jgi:histidyl-tRNA synthetase
VIAVVRGVLRRLGFERLTLRLSHTGIIRSILATAGYSPEEQLTLYDRLIDGDPSVWPEIAGALPQTGAPLTMLRDLTGGQVHGLANLQSALGPTLPAIVPPIEELRTIASSLELAGCSYELDLTIVRGFEYYTGPVFQVLIDGENVAGGGRYDGLIASQEGHSVPACGFAISIEPLLDRLDNPRPGEEINLIDVSIAGRSPSVLASALGLVTELHEQGYDAELVAQPLFKGRWTIEVSDRDGRAAYRLRDLTAGSSFDAATVNEVTQRIERGARA